MIKFYPHVNGTNFHNRDFVIDFRGDVSEMPRGGLSFRIVGYTFGDGYVFRKPGADRFDSTLWYDIYAED